MNWHVSKHDDNKDVVVRNEEGLIVANCEVDYYELSEDKRKAEIEKHAALIAAAPALLAALKNLIDRDLIKDVDGDHYYEVRELVEMLADEA